MLYPDLIDVGIDVYGGYIPAIPPQYLPPGASPFCQDVAFPQGSVRQRGGLLRQFIGGPIPSNAAVNGLKSYITPTLAQRLLAWDSQGNLYKESPQGTLTEIFSRPYSGLLSQSFTLFGREYQAFFNSAGGFDIPRQYDDTYWDRVSQPGPGLAPSAVDISVTLTAISRTGGIISGTTSAPHGLTAGSLVNIQGVNGDATFDGQWPVASVPTATTFTAWGAPGVFPISTLTRAGGIVTGVLSVTPTFIAGTKIIVANQENVSFNGEFTVASINGNTITWVQAGANAVAASGTLYTQSISVPIINFLPDGFNTPENYYVFLALGSNQTMPFSVGSTVIISGNSISGLNGTYTVLKVLPNQATPPVVNVIYFTVPAGYIGNGTGGQATLSAPNSSPAVSGVAGIAGSISAGFHQVSVAFITRQGFITKPPAPSIWSAAGGFTAMLSGIPTGPSYVIARLLLFTPGIVPPALTGSFYSLPNGSTEFMNASAVTSMMINDNTTTALNIDFNDIILSAGFQANYLFTQRDLGECAFAAGYNSRLVWLGERNKQQNFVNTGFDGGWNGNTPLGWTLDPTNGAGARPAIANGFTSDFGDALAIVGNGVTAIRGLVTQGAYQDYLNVPEIQPNTAYRVRARIASAGGLSAGTVHVNLQSTIGGFVTAGLAIGFATLTGSFQEFDALLTAAIATPPSDLKLQVYVDGTPNNGGAVIIDSIEPYPQVAPVNYSTAWLSHSFNPESYDNTTSQIQIRPNDGQQLRGGFPLRNNFVFGKDHYLCYVTDDGVNEPASWPVNEISSTIGICGPNAWDVTEEWACFVDRSGFYITWGSDPVKISQEIQEDASNSGKVCWKSINWAAAYTIWVRIDKVNKQILIGAPINGAVTPNVVFMLDYKWLDSAQDIAENPMVTYSAFTGKILAHGRGRRWTFWNITANSMCFAERADGTAQPFFGNGAMNGNIYQQVDAPTQLSDDGVAINSQWASYFAPSPMEEQGLQLGAHRKLLGYLKWRAVGAGILGISITSTARTTALRGYMLSTNPSGDGGRGINMHGERFSIQLGTNDHNSYWQLEKLILCMKKDPTIVVRGVNA